MCPALCTRNPFPPPPYLSITSHHITSHHITSHRITAAAPAGVCGRTAAGVVLVPMRWQRLKRALRGGWEGLEMEMVVVVKMVVVVWWERSVAWKKGRRKAKAGKR